jgi:nicotinate-nucleotide adenylyltransferase
MRHWHPPGSVQFYFITGLDAVLELPSWKDPYNIIKETSIVAVTRPGYSVERLDELPEAIKKAVVLLEIPMLAISSTAIRRRVAEGSSIRYLVPWNVEHYIYKKGLYIRDGR